MFTAFLTQHARSSVGGGVLRFLLPESDPPLVGWNGPGGWRSDWPSAVPAVAFASDWTGRLYLLATRQILRDSEPPVVLLDPATGEVVVLDHTLGEFLGETLARDWRRLLDADRLAAWQTAGGTVPTPQECVCPKVPMFLGGSAEMGDLELSPLLVAISVAGQLWEQVRTLPPGTPMSGVSIR